MKKPRYSYQEKTEFIKRIALRHASLECLIWPFVLRSDGYGEGFPKVAAHRQVCIEAHGPPPGPKFDAAHSCGVRSCVNPLHLSWKTKKANQADRVIHGTDCRGERSSKSKLTNIQAREIRNRDGESIVALSKEYGVSHTAVWLIQKGRTYKEA